MKLINVFIFVIFLFPLIVNSSKIIYVNPQSSCGISCNGTTTAPYLTIELALKSIIESNNTVTGTPNVIILKQGNFFGIGNTMLTVSIPIIIRSEMGRNVTTIDCRSTGNAFNLVNNPNVFIEGVTIMNCVGSIGGAISLYKSQLSLVRSALVGNRGDIGGAIFSEDSSLTIFSTIISNNNAFEEGGSIYLKNTKSNIRSTSFTCNHIAFDEVNITYSRNDITCDGCTTDISISSSTGYNKTTNSWGVKCINGGKVQSQPTISLCQTLNTPPSCDPIIYPTKPQYKLVKSVNDNSVTCSSLSFGYPMLFSGFQVSIYNCLSYQCNPTYLVQIGSDALVGFEDLSAKSGKLLGYFQSPRVGSMTFKFSSFGFDSFDVYINQKLILTGGYTGVNKVDTVTIYFKDTTSINQMFIMVSSSPNIIPTLSIEWKADTNYQKGETLFYFSNCICGDGIYDIGETCTSDKLFNSLNFATLPFNSLSQSSSTCGDGLCQESDPNSCIQDCYDYMNVQQCPSTQYGHFYPIYGMGDDTLGNMIYNQIVWQLPGSNHFKYGMNIMTSTTSRQPLFQFTYCNQESKILEYVYRETFYSVPDQLVANTFPKCEFIMESTTYQSTSEISNDYTQTTTNSAGGYVNSDLFNTHGSYDKDQTISKASSISNDQSGSYIATNTTCNCFNVVLDNINFHPQFIKRMAEATTIDEYVQIIEIYGTHFYSTSTMGGILEQITFTTDSSTSSMNGYSNEDMSKVNFQLSISNPSLNANVNGNRGSGVDAESYSEFSTTSVSTSITSLGGKMGAFGPYVEDSAPSTYGDWAQDVDLLPVPIDYQLTPIGSVIPSNWINVAGQSVYNMWVQAEQQYIENIATETVPPFSNYYMYWFVNPFTIPSPSTSLSLTSLYLSSGLKIDGELMYWMVTNQNKPVVAQPTTPGGTTISIQQNPITTMLPSFQTNPQTLLVWTSNIALNNTNMFNVGGYNPNNFILLADYIKSTYILYLSTSSQGIYNNINYNQYLIFTSTSQISQTVTFVLADLPGFPSACIESLSSITYSSNPKFQGYYSTFQITFPLSGPLVFPVALPRYLCYYMPSSVDTFNFVIYAGGQFTYPDPQLCSYSTQMIGFMDQNLPTEQQLQGILSGSTSVVANQQTFCNTYIYNN